MSFTSVDLLKDSFGPQAVDQFMLSRPGALEKLIIRCDSIITTASGLQPPADPATQPGNEQMLVYAGWIVRYLMMEHLSTTDRDEVERRRKDYQAAVDACAALRGVATSSTFERPAPRYSSTERVGEIL